MALDPALAGLPTAVRRPRLIAAVDAACDNGARLQRDETEGSPAVGGGAGGEEHLTVVPTLPDAPAWNRNRAARF